MAEFLVAVMTVSNKGQVITKNFENNRKEGIIKKIVVSNFDNVMERGL